MWWHWSSNQSKSSTIPHYWVLTIQSTFQETVTLKQEHSVPGWIYRMMILIGWLEVAALPVLSLDPQWITLSTRTTPVRPATIKFRIKEFQWKPHFLVGLSFVFLTKKGLNIFALSVQSWGSCNKDKIPLQLHVCHYPLLQFGCYTH